MSKYLLAIDAGTGSCRAVLFDTLGKQISVASREWTHISEDGVAGSMGFDCEKNWELICECLKEATKEIEVGDILAVSATSMREGIVLYDKDGKEIWAVANVDARAEKEVKELKEKFPKIEEEFYELSGQTFALGALPRLLWVKKHRFEIYEKIDKISMISDWVLAKLSGVIASDPSNAGTTGIYSLSNRDWMPSMAEKVGIKSDIFPPSIESGVVIGEVRDKESILSLGTKVVMGGGDTQLGAIGLGIVEEGEVAIIGGSFWQQVMNVKDPKPPKDMSIRINPHIIKGMSQVEGITFFSGLALKWFMDVFCESEKELAKQREVSPFLLLEEMASEVPVGSYGILPIFSDIMKYGKWYHASPSFLNLGLDSEKYNKASMFRALEENACIVSAENLENITKFTGIKVETIIFAGGASKGFLYPQILADATGKMVKIPNVKEATALGCAIVAGVGAGVYESIEEASRELVTWDKSYLPSMENHKLYKVMRKRWKKAYRMQLKLVDAGVTESMWKAPGL